MLYFHFPYFGQQPRLKVIQVYIAVRTDEQGKRVDPLRANTFLVPIFFLLFLSAVLS